MGGEAIDGHPRCWPLLVLMFAVALSSNAQVVPSGRETAGLAAEQAGQLHQALDDYVAALQALPDPPPADSDRRLREHIIKLALKLDPPPAVPDEAQQRITNGEATAKTAKIPKDVSAAIPEFQHALRLAPWLPAGYFDLGQAQEKLRDYPAAIRSFEFYLLAAPTAQDADSVQKRIIDLRGRFPAMYLKTHSIFTQSAMRPAWALDTSGELTVSNGSIQFRDSTDPKHSFAFPVSDVRSLERRRGPEGFPVLRIGLQNEKKFDLVPDTFGHLLAAGDNGVSGMEKAMNEGVAAIEKAIRDMASQQGISLK
jgi:tetratricopeptide (TPR) repeat protein